MRSFELTTKEIVEAISPTATSGDFSANITGVASLQEAQTGDLSFLGNSRYSEFVEPCKASILLLPEGHPHKGSPSQLVLNLKKPSLGFAQICGLIEAKLSPKPNWGIHPSAIIDRDAQVHPESYIGPMCVIEKNAQIQRGAILVAQVYAGKHTSIGEDSTLKPGVKILEDCIVGDRCILHSGCVVGSDGFGFEFENGAHKKVPQIGNVEIENDVEIGANATLDRARFGTTKIGAGSKLDNLVQIAHNVQVGKHNLLVAQSGIAGSTTLEDYVVVGGQAGVGGHLRVGTQTQVAAQSGVLKNLPPQQIVVGTPAGDIKTNYKIEALKRKLPEFLERLKKLEEAQKNPEE